MSDQPITWTARCPVNGCDSDARWTATPLPTSGSARTTVGYRVECGACTDDAAQLADVITGRTT
jgi:hypothetical protein